MSWDTPLVFFDDEDEDELINEFVRLSAKYHNFEPFQITHEIFKNRREPTMRANQAAMRWSADLGILRRIDEAKQVVEDKDLIKDKADWERRVLAVILDATLNDREKKVRIDGYNAIAKVKGFIDGDDDDNKGKGGGVVLNFIRDPRSDANTANAA